MFINKMEQRNNCSNIVIIFLILISLLLFMKFLAGGFGHDDLCKMKYGNDWGYEYNEYFGQTCIKVDYVTLKTLDRNYLPKRDEIEIDTTHCVKCNFLDFGCWINYCNFEEVQKGGINSSSP